MSMNSTDLLAYLRKISEKKEENEPVDIHELRGNMPIAQLVALLTELEQRDKIILELKTYKESHANNLIYEGKVRLMENP